ncbi:MAG: ABC transporter permease [Clostridiales bacterium]|nr:ABC transporter permease [Clostridiales bacterium]
MDMKKDRKIFDRILKCGVVTWILLVLIWQFGSLFYSDDFLPGPLVTLAGAGKLVANGTLWEDILISLQRVLKGWILGIAVAIPLGLCIGYFKKVGYLLEPFLNFFRFIPAIGLITLFLMWFGVGETSKVALIFYAVIFPVMINTIAGVKTVDPALVEAAESLGSADVRTFFTVIVPSAVPNIFTGVRLGLSSAIICIVAAEMLAASEGLGYLIYTSRLYYRTDWIFVGIFTLGILGFLADRLLQFLGKRFLKRFGVK